MNTRAFPGIGVKYHPGPANGGGPRQQCPGRHLQVDRLHERGGVISSKTLLEGLLLAAVGVLMAGVGGARAQMAADVDRMWCDQQAQSLLRNYRAVEALRTRREAGIAKLRPQHQALAREQADEWYYQRLQDMLDQRRALEAECRPLYAVPRRGEPVPRRAEPLPPPRQPPPQETWRYPPYQRYPDPTDPFSPGMQ